MNTLVNNKPTIAQNVWFSENKLIVQIEDGREVSVPLEWYPKLRDASDEELNNWRFIGGGVGIHWEDLDEDLSVEGFLR